MLCWQQIEENPLQKNSVTVSLARRLITIAPNTRMSKAAKKIMAKASGEKNQTPPPANPPSNPIDANKENVTLIHNNKTDSLPAIRDAQAYPKAQPIKRPEDMKVQKAEPESEPVNDSGIPPAEKQTTATLEGSVNRMDEKGQVFNPSGASLVLLRVMGHEKYYATTDGSGKFRFESIKPDGNYVLVCLSKYRYTRYIQEYYYNNYRTYPPYNGYNSYNSYNSYNGHNNYAGCNSNSLPGITANVIVKEKNNGKIGIGSFEVKRTNIRINTGCYPINNCSYAGSTTGGFYYQSYPYRNAVYGGNYGYYGYDNNFSIQRAVDVDYNISWHLRMDLKQPVKYKLGLTQNNADRNFSGSIEPEYTISREPYREITDIVPDIITSK
jgi:hypothetical protein